MAAIQMMNELQRLKTLHSSHKQSITVTIQPNQEQQRIMIAHNFSQKIVNNAVKRETTKYIFDQRIKLQEELLRKHNDEDGNSINSNESKETPLRRIQTAPSSRRIGENDGKRPVPLSNIGRIKSHLHRPHTTLSGTRGIGGIGGAGAAHAGKVEDFVHTIKTSKDPEEFEQELHDQVVHRAKDSKKVFDLICKGFRGGNLVQFSPRKPSPEIDLSHYSSANTEKLTKLEDLANFRKKDGILLYMDPSVNTCGKVILLKISYTKVVDIGEETTMHKEVPFWSNGNYYGMKVVKDLLKAQMGASGYNRLADGGEGGWGDDAPVDTSRPSVPGWQGKAPLFIPALTCQLSLGGERRCLFLRSPA
eukprot:gene40126-48895_t